MRLVELLAGAISEHGLVPRPRHHHSRTALLLCLIASVGYGFGAVLQAIGARRNDARGAEGLVAMVKQPIFLLGLLADFVSWSLSRFALHELPLFAVQTILAGSLAITVVLAHFLLGAVLNQVDKLAIVTAMGGLLIVGVSAGEEQARGITHLLKVCILLGMPAVAVLGLIALKLQKSVVLAVIAGGAFTGSALAARAITLHDMSASNILTEPLAWAVVGYAAIALVLHSFALMRGHVGPVTAAMWSTEVLVATVIGFVFLGDRVRRHFELPAIVGIAITVAATIVLARSPAQDLEHRAPMPTAGRASGDGTGGHDRSADSRATTDHG